MAFWEMLQSIMGYGYPPCGQTDGWMEGQTLVKTLPSLVLRTRAVIIQLQTKSNTVQYNAGEHSCLNNDLLTSRFVGTQCQHSIFIPLPDKALVFHRRHKGQWKAMQYYAKDCSLFNLPGDGTVTTFDGAACLE